MRQLIVIAMTLFSIGAQAGGSEVPWPKDSEQYLQVRDLGGVWVSQHLDAPQVVYYFSLERGGISELCPFILRVFEIDSVTGQVLTTGGGVYCSETIDRIVLVLYDSNGQARKYLDIVGLIKPQEMDVLGPQLLGFTAMELRPESKIIYQDTFYKYSR